MKPITKEKRTFSNLFLLLAIMLVLLPFITSFQDLITNIVLHIKLYRILQDWIVPYEMRIVTSVLNLLHIPSEAGVTFVQFNKNGQNQAIYLAWNCIGWQSFVLLFITFTSGLSGDYSWSSKIQTLLLGIFGTYVVNIIRLLFVILMYYYTGTGIGIVFHDYFVGVLSIGWLFLFWYIAYTFLLERRKGKESATVS